MQEKGSLSERGRTLEDEFFLKEDMKMIEKLKQLKKMEETREALANTSGIRNQEVLNKLLELNIQPETLAALSAVPLVEIAWADGTMDAKEKQAILAGARQLGIAQEGVELLEQWLERRPEPGLLIAWTHFIEGLSEQLSSDELSSLKSGLLSHARAVAEAAGGLLGLGKISDAEQQILKRLEAAFKK